MSSEPMQQAYRLIREGRKSEAVRLLSPIVRANPRNADAWWLLANAVDDPVQKRDSLERVLQLRPNDERARKMLDGLPRAPRASVPPPLIAEEPEAEEFVSVVDEDFPPYDEDILFDDDLPIEYDRVSRSGTSPATIILALIALFTVVSCGLCLLAAAVSIPTVSRVVGDVVGTLTREPMIATVGSMITSVVPGGITIGTPAAPDAELAETPPAGVPAGTATPQPVIPSGVETRGTIAIGEIVHGTVSSLTDDGWTFTGEAAARVIITLDATEQTLDPQLYLYNDAGLELAENDDIDSMTNRNSRIVITLPYTGSYTIRVSAFGTGGNYELALFAG